MKHVICLLAASVLTSFATHAQSSGFSSIPTYSWTTLSGISTESLITSDEADVKIEICKAALESAEALIVPTGQKIVERNACVKKKFYVDNNNSIAKNYFTEGSFKFLKNESCK